MYHSGAPVQIVQENYLVDWAPSLHCDENHQPFLYEGRKRKLMYCGLLKMYLFRYFFYPFLKKIEVQTSVLKALEVV